MDIIFIIIYLIIGFIVALGFIRHIGEVMLSDVLIYGPSYTVGWPVLLFALLMLNAKDVTLYTFKDTTLYKFKGK